jgi:hypothetical protein
MTQLNPVFYTDSVNLERKSSWHDVLSINRGTVVSFKHNSTDSVCTVSVMVRHTAVLFFLLSVQSGWAFGHVVALNPLVTSSLRRVSTKTETFNFNKTPLCMRLQPPIEPVDDRVEHAVCLKLDRGVRVARIVTASTSSHAAMSQLCLARTRSEIMQICEKRHKTCVLSEHTHLPPTINGRGRSLHHGWQSEQRPNSFMRGRSGVPGSVLWVADIYPYNAYSLSVGSWLLGSISLHNTCHALFTSSTARREQENHQQMVLVRPGFASPVLLRSKEGKIEWVFTFIELQVADELGAPVHDTQARGV